jgi:hypothetical protein
MEIVKGETTAVVGSTTLQTYFAYFAEIFNLLLQMALDA